MECFKTLEKNQGIFLADNIFPGLFHNFLTFWKQHQCLTFKYYDQYWHILTPLVWKLVYINIIVWLRRYWVSCVTLSCWWRLAQRYNIIKRLLWRKSSAPLLLWNNLPQSKEVKPIQSSAACVSVPWWLPNSHDRNQKCLLENLPVERSILIQFSQCLVTWCYATELTINVQSALRYCRHEVTNGCMFSSGFVFFTLLWTWRFKMICLFF